MTYRVLVFSNDQGVKIALESIIPPNYTLEFYAEFPTLEQLRAGNIPIALTLLDTSMLVETSALRAAMQALDTIPVVLLDQQKTNLPAINSILLRLKVLSILKPPFATEENRSWLLELLDHAPGFLERLQLKQDLSAKNAQLNQRIQELNVIYTIGKSVTASLDLAEVLGRIVDACVNITQAEEGFILLREKERLFLRAAKNMDETLVQRLNVEASDSVAWRVIQSGRPVLLRRETKIVTGFLIQALLYVPLKAPGQGVIGILGVINRRVSRDFTEQQLYTLSAVADFAAIAVEKARLFQAAEAEQQRIRTLLERAAEVILITDTHNCLVLWSDSAARAFNIPPNAAGEPIEIIISHPQLLELFSEPEEEVQTNHAEIALDNGRIFNAQLTTDLNRGRFLVMQDITHLKELDRLKSEFVSTVSHDLRTPLTTIQGYIELLDRVGPINQTQKQFIGKVHQSLTHITDLISDLLDIGRIEAGYDLEMHPLRLDQLLQETNEVMRHFAEEYEIQLHYQMPAAPLWVTGNGRRLRQVVENLISNAIKYNHPGGWVEIAAERSDGHIIVSVRDNGIGIPVEEQPSIFERFYRVRNAETDGIEGTGLGLSIVKSVVEKHKGRVWVESIPGKGSNFSFILPINPNDITL